MGIYFNKGIQTSESFVLGGLLALVGGYLDTYTYFGRGEVFANAQTGNMVLVAISIAEKNYINTIKYIIPIICFFLGVIVAEFFKHNQKVNTLHWRQNVLLIEILVLFSVMFIKESDILNILANSLVSFVCALQVESFRKIHSTTFATTMCTGNLRTASENLFLYKKNKDKTFRDKSIRSFSIILIFIIGAILGTVLTLKFNTFSLFVVILLLIASFVLMNREKI
ncbi:MAG: YoaK family protein [Pleomorphochaeta sp.]|nr:YoaK family protein [Sphaerochaetaceae bacterium]